MANSLTGYQLWNCKSLFNNLYMTTTPFIFQKIALKASITLGLLALSATQANAFTYTFGDASTSSNDTATGAAAAVDFDFVNLGNDQVQLNLDFLNTTGQNIFGAGATSSALTGIAFDIFDDISVASYSLNGNLDTWLSDVEFAPFTNTVGNFDIGFADNNNFTGGNANEAVDTGENSRATLVFNTSADADALRERFRQGFSSAELNIAARFQQVNAGAGSDKLLGGRISDPFSPPEAPREIPEPAAMGGLALLIGYLKLRHRNVDDKVIA